VASTLVPAAIAADDTRTLRVADVGLSFAVPKSWVSVNARDVAGQAGDRLRKENPQLGAILDTLARPGSPVRLFAFDPETLGGIVTNVNVLVTPAPRGVSFAEFLRVLRAELQRLPGIVGTPGLRTVSLRAGRAARTHVRAGVILSGQRKVGDLTQFAFLRDGHSIVVTFTTSVAAASKTAPLITRVSRSIRFA
jgi:hypothetical protein